MQFIKVNFLEHKHLIRHKRKNYDNTPKLVLISRTPSTLGPDNSASTYTCARITWAYDAVHVAAEAAYSV